MELSLQTCSGLNNKIGAALDADDTGSLADILRTLHSSDASGKLSNLASSKLAKTIKKLELHDDAKIAATATALVKSWKALIPKAKPKPADGGTAKSSAEGTSQAKASESSAALAPAPVLAEPSAAGAECKLRTQWVSTGDSVRDSVIKKLKEAFDKGIVDNEASLRDFDGSDSAQMAQECEEGMHTKFGGATKEYKARFRSLMFNLQDSKNPEFILSVVSGQRHVSDLASMDVKDMASEAIKKQRAQWTEHSKMALMDKKSYEKYAGKQVEDGILKCPKCKSMKTEYVEVQTRSADEPTTKKCLCNSCNYRWKFC